MSLVAHIQRSLCVQVKGVEICNGCEDTVCIIEWAWCSMANDIDFVALHRPWDDISLLIEAFN